MICRCAAMLGGTLLLTGALALPAQTAHAADDLFGIERLRDERGARVPDGRGVVVAQVEPPSRVAGDDKAADRRSHLPDKSSGEFDGVRFHGVPANAVWGSGHATMTAARFYGRHKSFAPGIEEVHVFTANEFLRALASSLPPPPIQL